MRILIFEDELPAAERLVSLIKKVEPTAEVVETIDTISGGIIQLTEKPLPDLIISDVELADGLCFEIFDAVNVQVPVIFTTAYNHYAIRAFEANAIDYLLKPVDAEKLKQAFVRARERANFLRPEIDYKALAQAIEEKEVREEKRYLVKYGNKLVLVKPNEAAYFYSEQKACFLVTPAGKAYPLDESLSRVEEDLDDSRYFRINRNFIACIDHIDEMQSVSKGRLSLRVNPPSKHTEHTVVSAERSPQFRKWLKGEV